MRRAAAIAAAAITLAGAASPAAAQQQNPSGTYVADPTLAGDLEPVYVPELRSSPRRELGFDVGLGVLGGLCDGCPDLLGGLSLDVHAGEQVTCRIALVADVWGVGHLLPPDSGIGLVTQVMATATARVWITPEVWLQGGLGPAMFGYAHRGEASYSIWGVGAIGAIGSELRHRPGSGIDVSVRAGVPIYDDAGDRLFFYNVAAVLGWHWN